MFDACCHRKVFSVDVHQEERLLTGSATLGVNGTLEASLFDPDGRTCTPTLVPATLNTVPDVFPVIPACIAIV